MLTFTLLLCSFFAALNAESLVDLPLKLPDKTYVSIEATLTDTSSGDVYFIQEYVAPNPVYQGKIEIASKTQSVNVHYTTSSKSNFKTNLRLVLQETSCDLYTYSSTWDKLLPSVTKPLLNLILLMGPSVLYRLNDYRTSWKPISDANVRGTTMHGYQTTMNQRLKITYYYKTQADDKKPSRIVFDGYDPGNRGSAASENLILDIHSITETSDDLSKLVQVYPGIGCPIYVSDQTSLPALEGQRLQTIVQENVQGASPSSTRDKLYLDENQQLMRRITTSLGVEVEAIYDYNLGLIHILQSSGCLTQPLGVSAPGLSGSNKLSINSYLWMDLSYYFLGEVDYNAYPGVKVSAWESVVYDMTLHTGTYAKVVTTLYMAISDSKGIFTSYILVGATRNAYSKGSAGDYLLVERTTRYYYDFRDSVDQDDFNNLFNIGDCYTNADERIDLSFTITCTDSNCLTTAERNLIEFKNTFKDAILTDFKISPLRIDGIDVVGSDDSLTIYTTFLERPTINYAFQRRYLSLDDTFLSKLSGISVEDESTCLQAEASYRSSITNVLYCTKNGKRTCYHVDKGATIVENGDTYCTVFDIPLGNLYRLGHELSLTEVHEYMLDKTRYSSLRFHGSQYKVENVIDKTPIFVENTEFPFSVAYYAGKLTENDAYRTTFAEDISTLGECYRACVSSDEDECETFSYCQGVSGVECLITDSLYNTISANVTADSNCKVYQKNHYSDYSRVENKKFKSTSSATVTIPLYDCAAYCYTSQGCYSFQMCGGKCTFGGYYTDSNSQYDENCDIYIPKVATQYQVTGKKIVEDTYHTELNLNLEQCAAICYDTSNEGEACKSFNYCPKGKTPSSCMFSKSSVNDANVKTIDSANCYNYELANTNSNNKVQNSEIQSAGTSSGAAFGIIVLFLVGGLVIGFVLPIAYTKTKSIPLVSSIGERIRQTSSDVGFGWSRQVNDVAEDETRFDQTLN